jgi:hypothetical protein
MALSFIEESKLPERKVAFDWWGAGTLGVCLAAIVLVLDKGADWGWLSVAALVSYAVAVVFGILFYFIENKHPEPVVDFKFFKNAAFVNTLANNFLIFMAMMGSIFLVPIFAQTFLGYTATESGYLFIPMALGLMVAAPMGARLVGKFPAGGVIGVSTLVAAFGIFLFAGIDPRSTALDLTIPLFVMAFGMGFGMAQRTSAIASAVPPSEIGIASSLLALVRNISGAFGIAIFATILNSTIEHNVLSISALSTLYAHTVQATAAFTSLIILKAQVDAYATIYLIAAVILFFGGIVSFFITTPEGAGPQDKEKEREAHMMAEAG